MVTYIKSEIARLINRPAQDIDVRKGFYDMGLDSAHLLKLVKILEQTFQQQFYPTLLLNIHLSAALRITLSMKRAVC